MNISANELNDNQLTYVMLGDLRRDIQNSNFGHLNRIVSVWWTKLIKHGQFEHLFFDLQDLDQRCQADDESDTIKGQLDAYLESLRPSLFA